MSAKPPFRWGLFWLWFILILLFGGKLLLAVLAGVIAGNWDRITR